MIDRIPELVVAALAIAGWAVIILLVIFVPVTPGAQLVLYTAGFVALSGTFALALELYHSRAGDLPRQRAFIQLGSGMRLAFVTIFALWLQSLRVLTIVNGVLLATGFFVLEFLYHQLAGGRKRTDFE